MSDFVSLTGVLEGYFDRQLAELPDALSERVLRDFFPMPWDDLSPDQRYSVALQWDYQHDPASEQDQQFWWDFFIRKDRIKEEIAEWEVVSVPTASDLEKKEARLAELRRELAAMEQKERNARGEHLGHRGRRRETSSVSDKLDYIAYPKALKLLSDRLNATPEEIATWVWMGQNDGGLNAYLNANELEPPPRFSFDYYMGDDYLSPLMACWFLEDDIIGFQPTDRYITGMALIERWEKQPGIHPEAFIRAKIAESRLLDIHPAFGGTRGSFFDDESYPSLESGMFVLSHVEKIEVEDFGMGQAEHDTEHSNKSPGHLNYDPELQKRANRIAADKMAATGRTITRNKVAKILAQEVGIGEATVKRRIRKQWKNDQLPE